MNAPNRIEIWSPKYSTQSVLVDVRKVKNDNIIYFTKANHLKGKEYYLSGDVARESDIISNGKIKCYDVPLGNLELIPKLEEI